VQKWFDGNDNPTDTTNVSSVLGLQYKSQSGPLFGATTNYSQVNQGGVGDCYFEAGMVEVALNSPDMLKKMITTNANGSFTVDFYNGASQPHDYVTVDGLFPTMTAQGASMCDGSKMLYDSGGNASAPIWSAVLEKAYVEFRTQTGGVNDYTAIAGGLDNGLQALTGQTVADTYLSASSSAASLGSLLTSMANALNGHNAVMMNSAPTISDTPHNITSNHMYAVLAVDVSKGMVTLDNPWNGNGSTNPMAMVFTDSISTLAHDGVGFHVATSAARAFG
jgi:hypothetical protein